MGYNTQYSLKIISGDDGKTNHEKAIGEISDYGSSTFEEEIKWYDHDKDMITYSKQHPNTVFALKGIGEESDDMWMKYYKNGKMYRIEPEIIYQDYNESLLE